jgi:hypothetical protein
VPEEIAPSLDANALFLFAICVGVLKNTVDGNLTVVDIVVMIYVCYGYLFSVLSIFSYRTRRFAGLHISVIGSFVRLCLAIVINVYAAWFWIHGVHVVKDNVCQPLMFMFTPVKVFGNARFFWIIGAFCFMTYYSILFILAVMSIVAWNFRLFRALVAQSRDDFKAEWNSFWAYTTKSLGDEIEVDYKRFVTLLSEAYFVGVGLHIRFFKSLLWQSSSCSWLA